MLGVRVLGVRMPMDMGMGRLMRGVRMVVRDRGERSRVIAGLACAPIAERMNECAALHPSEAGADQRYQAIADNLDHANGIVHGLGRCVERDAACSPTIPDQGLQQRGSEGKRNAGRQVSSLARR
jgi:hypothetical protein